ncbi:MAG: 50S ribosomal protein L25/general stress protein Ctc [Hyphomicrobiaceae bacterium]
MAQERITLSATVRERVGKGAARHVRREGKIPAVIYGNKEPAQSIALDYHTFAVEYFKGKLSSTVIEIDVTGKKTLVIPRDFQLDPVSDKPLHADFMRIAADGRVTVEVPLHVINEEKSPGLKRGGNLNMVRHEIEVTCPFDAIPAEFVIDLEGLDIGETIHVSAITLPDNVKPVIDDRDFTLATIQSRGGKDEAEDAAEEAAAAEASAEAGGEAGDEDKSGEEKKED